MKKYLFLLIVPIILFFPKDVFALDIHFYTDDYVVINSCYDCTSLSAPGVQRVRFTYPTQVFQNLEYRFQFDTQFHYYNTTELPTTHIDLFGASVNQNIEGYTWKGTIKEFPPTGGVLRGYTFDATWTQTTNGGNVFVEITFNDLDSYDLFSVVVDNYSLTTTGDSTSDVIAGVGQQIIDNQNKNQQQTNEKLDKIDDTLNDDDTTSSQNQINDFFNNFDDNHHGLSSVITAPLVFIRNLLNHSCTPLHLELPFVDTSVNLPCMKSIYQEHFGIFFNLYQTITTGVIAYSVLIRMFATVKGLQDPQNDKIEVFNL